MENVRALTFTDKRKLEAELEELKVAQKRVTEDIKTARGFGDLSENAEYTEAKAEEARVNGRKLEIERILETSVFIDDSNASTDAVSLGNVVKVLDMEYDEEDEFTIVGFTEADPTKGFISNESPIGMALMGAKCGEIVTAQTPGGALKLKVLEISIR